MKFQIRTIEVSLFAAVMVMSIAGAPVVAAPASTAPVTEVKVASAAPVLKPVTAKIEVPIPSTPAGLSEKHSTKRTSDYRFSNPSRWNSDRTCNSIRNQ